MYIIVKMPVFLFPSVSPFYSFSSFRFFFANPSFSAMLSFLPVLSKNFEGGKTKRAGTT
jgi:hypothetical protein